MPAGNALINRFNRGEIDPLALARVDVENLRDTCETLTNWLPLRLGPMMFRPGLGDIGAIDMAAYAVPFVASIEDTAILEFTDSKLRFWLDDELITRTSVSAAVTNGTFESNITDGWTDASEGGSAAISHDSAAKAMAIQGDGEAAAVARQNISIPETGEKHALRIVVEEAELQCRLGYTAGGNEIFEGTLGVGTHSLAFAPTQDLWVEFSSRVKYRALLQSVAFETTGDLELPHDVPASSLSLMRYTQTADVVYFAWRGKPFVVQRRGERESWSVIEYRTKTGPFDEINTSGITMTPSDFSGNITMTASKAFFTTEKHLGTLLRLDAASQTVTATLSGGGQFTNEIRVTGRGGGRKFEFTIEGTWSGDITLQSSVGAPGAWVDEKTYSNNQDEKTFNDNLDNQIIYYRLGFKAGDHSSGSAQIEMVYSGGILTGVGRVTKVNSPTEADVQVLEDYGATEATEDWYLSEWSEGQGYPSAVAIFEGRLWWAGRNAVWGSESDQFERFDIETEGNSRSIRRTIGFGPVEDINWLFSAMGLLMGTAANEISVRSTAFTEALTHTNTNLKEMSTSGSDETDIVKIDQLGYFVDRSQVRIYEMDGSERTLQPPYDLMTLNPDIALAGIKRMAVQRKPETRIHVVLDDGKVLVNLQDPVEEVRAWYRVTISGNVEDVVVLPGQEEDQVYYITNRDNTSGRRLEKMAKITEARGGSMSKHFDAFKAFTSPGASVDMSHLDNGTTVGIWADGQDRGTATVSGGSVTLPASDYTNVCVGESYEATYKSSKLAYYAGMGTALAQTKRAARLALVLRHYVPGALTYGPTADYQDPLPDYEDGALVDQTATIEDYDEPAFVFPGQWETDARLHMKATGPVTCLAAVIGIETHDK